MTALALLGTALPYVFLCLVAVGAHLYFNKYLPWRNRRRSLGKQWDIHVK